MAKKAGREGSKDDAPASEMPAAVRAFGSKLAQLRTERDFTQRRLSERSGVSQPHISQLEQGNLEPRLVTILALAGALGVEAADLLPPTPKSPEETFRLLEIDIQSRMSEPQHATYLTHMLNRELKGDRLRMRATFNVEDRKKHAPWLRILAEAVAAVEPAIQGEYETPAGIIVPLRADLVPPRAARRAATE